MCRVNLISYIFIALSPILFLSPSRSETTTIDLNINKNAKIHSPTARGNIPIGSDKLSICYRTKRCVPSCLTTKNSLLEGDKLIAGLLGNSGCCNSNNEISDYKDLYYVDLGIGRTINYVNGESSFKRTPTLRFTDTFKTEAVGKGALLYLSGGYVWRVDSPAVPFASLGLEYSYTPSVRTHGSIYVVEEIPAFNYQYSISHTSLRLLGKINLHRWKYFMPYASLGLGASQNTIENYKEYTLSIPRSSPTIFKNEKTISFSYGVGAGIDYIYNKNLLLSLGYRYDDFGRSKSGRAVGSYKNQHLSNNFTANSLVFTGRYLFE